ncbi:MAG: hypothetical protein AAF215_18775 [Cyanobacteria bacterium P01_A01_bin.123]
MVNPLKLGFTISANGGNQSAREVLLMEQALKDIREENKRVQQTAAKLKDVYNLDDSEIRQVIARLQQMQKETEEAQREAGGLSRAIEGIGQGIGQGIFGAVTGLASGAIEGVKGLLASTLEVGSAAQLSETSFKKPLKTIQVLS